MTTQEYNWLLSGMQKAAAAVVQAAQPDSAKDMALRGTVGIPAGYWTASAFNKRPQAPQKPAQTFWNQPRVNNDWLDRAGAAYTNTWNKIKGAGKSAINWAQSPSGSQTLKWFLQDPPAYNR